MFKHEHFLAAGQKSRDVLFEIKKEKSEKKQRRKSSSAMVKNNRRAK